MTARKLSRSGNVIAADFRARPERTITLRFETEPLYSDDRIMVTRTTVLFDDKPIMVLDLAMASYPAIPLDENFIVWGEPMDRPGDPTGSAGNVVACRFSLVYSEAE